MHTVDIVERITSTSRDWRSINVDGLKRLRTALLTKHGSITIASATLRIPYNHLSDILHGRRNYPSFVAALQADLNLTDKQVLLLWPMLREWPKKGGQA